MAALRQGLNELKGEVYTVQQHAAKSLAEAMAGIGEALTQQSAATVAVDTALRAALDDEAGALTPQSYARLS
eukprot:SAG11_NODE_268_length_11447_cov_3.136135_12_plen_72_part_00